MDDSFSDLDAEEWEWMGGERDTSGLDGERTNDYSPKIMTWIRLVSAA